MELFYTPCSGAINQGQELGRRRQGAGGEEGEGAGNIKRGDNEPKKTIKGRGGGELKR